MKCTVFDRQGYRITHREYTDEGFLRVPGRVARTGIQEYLARELGMDGDPMRVIRVYRPAEEVFADASLDSYESADVTNTHPPQLVTADTYKQHAVGTIRSKGRQEGEFVVVDMIVKDSRAIKDIESGKCELSAGYTAVYDETPGVTVDGEAYDFIQRDIRINHVAIVERARAGAHARVFDHNPENIPMTVKVTLDSGRSVEVQDEATAALLSDAFERLNKQVTDAQAEAEKAKATADDATEQLEEARKASSDEAIKARVTEVATVNAVARKVAGDKFSCDSLDVIEIKRAAMAIARPARAWADEKPAYVEAAFDMAAEKVEDEDEEGKESKESNDSLPLVEQLRQLAQDASRTKVEDKQTVSHYDAHKQSLSQAHKGGK